MSTYDLEKYKKGFTSNDSVNSAAQKKTAAESKVAGYGDFNYSKQSEYDKALGDYLGRDKFSYDVNKDALYSSLKKQYENSGKMAMEDTMGKANAMNGGYGTSYGVTAGQQVYNDYMKEAAAMMPEYYQMALDRYIAEGDELLNRYNLLGSDRANEQAEWDAGYNRALAEREYAAGDYADQYNRAYGEWADKRDYDYQLARDAETDKQWQQNFDYQRERDAVSDDQWQQSFDYQKERDLTDDAWKQTQLDWEKEAAGYEARIAELENGGGYEDMIKASRSKAVQTFENALLSREQFEKGTKKYTDVTYDSNGAEKKETKRFDNYEQFVDFLVEKYYEDGKLTENEVAYLKGAYGLE